MGFNTALKNQQILDNAYGILGIEFMAAAQALDLRDRIEEKPYQVGTGTAKAREVIRRHVEFLDIDRPLYPDHNAIPSTSPQHVSKLRLFILDISPDCFLSWVPFPISITMLETFRLVDFIDFLRRHLRKAGVGRVGIFQCRSANPRMPSSFVLVCDELIVSDND